MQKETSITTKKQNQMKTENKVWTIASVYAISIITIAILLTSCGASKGCHNKGYYVSKDIKKAQGKSRF
jgi:hypothetical protein